MADWVENSSGQRHNLSGYARLHVAVSSIGPGWSIFGLTGTNLVTVQDGYATQADALAALKAILPVATIAEVIN